MLGRLRDPELECFPYSRVKVIWFVTHVCFIVINHIFSSLVYTFLNIILMVKETCMLKSQKIIGMVELSACLQIKLLEYSYMIFISLPFMGNINYLSELEHILFSIC